MTPFRWESLRSISKACWSSSAESLEISAVEYEAVRKEGARFVVVPGHERDEIERVVKGNSHYLVVETLGRGAEIARGDDPPLVSARPEAHPSAAEHAAGGRPRLLFFCGQARRVEGFIAQVLQRRRNHDTFQILRIDPHARFDLARRCSVERFPALVVVEDKRVRVRVEQPRGCAEIRTALAPWLR